MSREMRAPGEVALIVNELTEETRRALVDRCAVLLIGTPRETLCRNLVNAMIEATTADAPAKLERNFLQPQVYLPESVRGQIGRSASSCAFALTWLGGP